MVATHLEIEYPIDDLEFGKLKVDLEEWFYQIGGQDINFTIKTHIYSDQKRLLSY